MVDYPRLLQVMDNVDSLLVRWGVKPAASWQDARRARKLYAGKLRRGLPQYGDYIGLTPFSPSSRNIPHDVTKAMPLADEIDIYQSEDVFEHLPYNVMPDVLNHVYDALRPGGFFRLSLPDYRADVYNSRCLYVDGEIIFDPGGGGRYADGKVVEGGHLWFPVFENVVAFIDASKFENYEILEGYDPDGERIMKRVDYARGYVQRTSAHDPRVRSDPRPLSLIVDFFK